MKKAVLAAMIAAATLPATPAIADPHHGWHGDHHGGGDHRGGGHHWHGHDAWHGHHGWNGRYAYDRRGRYLEPVPLAREDRVWRGRDGRYYCRRHNGTTGLIVGAVAGGVLGNVLAGRHDTTLGTLLGAGGGALLGRQIDRGEIRCR